MPAIARIETKIDQLLEYRQDHEKRLRSLERERWIHRGAAGVLMLVASKMGLTNFIGWPPH